MLQQKKQVSSGRKFSMTLLFRSALLLLGKEALLFAVQINYKEKERKEEKIKKGKKSCVGFLRLASSPQNRGLPGQGSSAEVFSHWPAEGTLHSHTVLTFSCGVRNPALSEKIHFQLFLI